MEKLVVNEDAIKKAVTVVTDALEKANVTPLEGACAMQAILQTLAEQGLDVRAQRRLNA